MKQMLHYKTTILRGESGPEIVKYANEQKVDIEATKI